jgi:hypothetical protein
VQDGERRPADGSYYADGDELLMQGDIFMEIPFGHPFPPEAISHEEHLYLSGPFETGFGMLISPTGSFRNGDGYAHPVRVVAPILPLERMLADGALTESAAVAVAESDSVAQYMYLPALGAMPESVALLYHPTTLHHDYLDDRRIAQLGPEAAAHLKAKLATHFTEVSFDAASFGAER